MRTSGFLKTTEGSKYLLCDGSEIPSNYPKLRSLMTHTPDLRDRVPQGAGAYAVNTKIEPELPNIYGSVRIDPSGTGNYAEHFGYGAFYDAYYSKWCGKYDLSSVQYKYGCTHAGFDASRISTIYKDDCNTVQPPAVAVNFYIKAK